MDNFVADGGLRLMTDAEVEAYLNSIPVGYRFCPTDEELVLDYLRKKVLKLPLPANKIRDVNIYKYSPEELYEKYKEPREERMYFFTSRNRKYPKGCRPNRAAGKGFWKASGADRAVGPKDNPFGYNKSLVYYQGDPRKPVKTDWLMHEFTLNLKNYPSHENKAPDDSMMLDNCVLCQMYKKFKKGKAKHSTIISSSTMVGAMIDQSRTPFMQSVPKSNVPEGSPMPNPDAMGGSSSRQIVSREQDLISLPHTMAHPDAMSGSSSQHLVSREKNRTSLPPAMAHPIAASAQNGILSSSQMLGNCDGQTAIPMPESKPNMSLEFGGQNYCYQPASNQVQQYQNYNPAASNQIQPYQHYNPYPNQASPGDHQMMNVVRGDDQMMNVSRGHYMRTPQGYSLSPLEVENSDFCINKIFN